ncbi:hypothetical protein B9Z19DRAFT_1131473 [Tuber borchii]|uniref:Uncharacterized protein n=1 Tax=Tuber borchii TaxID=42251 RepID=A0A2T6ZIL3_TUBBO|nr:hypothetical protein B9Z19DRAFT_1131473 [Tuber borchii]
MSASSASSHRPHKPTSIARKLSKQGRHRSQQPQPPPSAYIMQLARTSSKRDKKRIRNFDKLEDDRPMSRSSLPARDSIVSSLSSNSSMRAYKVRTIFTPRPKLHYDNSTGTSPTKSAHLHPLTPSRSNSRSIPDGRYSRAGITDEELLRGRWVDELADELDVHGIKEALDRDRRRRERRRTTRSCRGNWREELGTGASTVHRAAVKEKKLVFIARVEHLSSPDQTNTYYTSTIY